MSASTSQNQRIAVIGLGSMGYGMAISLKRAGHSVIGCDVSADAVARFVKDGGAGATTPAEAAKGADIVVSVVVNAAQTETILFGKDGVAESLPKDSVFISSATMDPDVARRLAKQLEATGRNYLDAPISGGAQRAAQGELTILASGSAAAFAKARPALDAMAAKLYELGDAAGQGAAFKMINQLLAGVHIAAASEAMAFAAKQGLDIRKVYEVITRPPAIPGCSRIACRMCSTATTRRAAQSKSSSRISASSRTWRAPPDSRCRSPLQPSRCF